MCRLFGLIANKEVDIKFSMLEASHRFKDEGKFNPHGWGIGWYENGTPQVEKYANSAFSSYEFDKISTIIKSRIFISHVRYSTIGRVAKENSHPFLV